jgi:hypothetical protein
MLREDAFYSVTHTAIYGGSTKKDHSKQNLIIFPQSDRMMQQCQLIIIIMSRVINSDLFFLFNEYSFTKMSIEIQGATVHLE